MYNLIKDSSGFVITTLNNLNISLYTKMLKIEGVTNKVVKEGGRNLVFYLGGSSPIYYRVPSTVKIEVLNNMLEIKGLIKEEVGKVVAELKRLNLAKNPYVLKGIYEVSSSVKLKVKK